METKDIPTGKLGNWVPITDPHELAVLAKLGEEACELGTALFRCIEQGLQGEEPTTHKVNKKWLEDEIADVLALTDTAIARLGLDWREIEARRVQKVKFKKPWFEWLIKNRK